MEKRRRNKTLIALITLIIIFALALITAGTLLFLQGDYTVVNPDPFDKSKDTLVQDPNDKNSYKLKVNEYYFKNSKKDSPLIFLKNYDTKISAIQFNQNIDGDLDGDAEYGDVSFNDIKDNILKDKTVTLNIYLKGFLRKRKAINVTLDFDDYTFAYLENKIVIMENIKNYQGAKKREQAIIFADRVLSEYSQYSWYKDKTYDNDGRVNLSRYGQNPDDDKIDSYDIYTIFERKSVNFVFNTTFDLVLDNVRFNGKRKQIVQQDQRLAKPFQDPEKNGYTFVEWTDQEGNPFDFETTLIKKDTIVVAKWKKIQYTLDYINEGEPVDNPNSYNVETPTITLASPSKKGHTFEGWSDDNGLTRIVDYKILKGSTKNKILRAFFRANTYTVTYVYNDIDDSEKEILTPVVYGSQFSVFPVNIDGLKLINYSILNEDGTEEILTSDIKQQFEYLWDKDIKIKINFQKTVYEISFDAGKNATNVPNKIIKLQNEYVEEPSEPIREGYTFIGWFDQEQKDNQKEKGNKIDFPYALTKSISVFAKWKINTYTTLFNPNGGVWPTNNDTVILRNESQEQVYPIYSNYKEIIHSAPPVYRFGYEFGGWFTSNSVFTDDNKLFKKTQSGVEENYIVLEDKNVYAKWIKKDLNIKFVNTDPNNSQTTVINQKYDDGFQFPIPRERNDGYEFVGWSKQDTTTVTDAVVTNVKDLDFKNTEQDPLVLYSIWAFHIFKISFDTRGGTPVNSTEYNANDNQIIAKFNEVIKLPTTSPEDKLLTKRPGYNFVGWFYDDDQTPTDSTFKVKNSFTINAHWEKILDYKLIYDAVDIDDKANELEVDWHDRFSDLNNKVESYDVESYVELPVPTKRGYKFLGWTVKEHPNNESDKNDTHVQQLVQNMVPAINYAVYPGTYGTKHFTANFVKNTYYITYNFNNELNNVLKAKVKFGYEYKTIIPERRGYKFVGWKNSGEKFESGIWDRVEDVAVSATWEKQLYEAIFLDDRDEQVFKKMYNYGDELTTDEASEKGRGYKIGKRLIKWQLKGKDVVFPYKVYENLIFKAVYEERLYTLTYNDEGFKTDYDLNYNYKIPEKNPKETPANKGKNFLGWFYIENGNEYKLTEYYGYDKDLEVFPRFDTKYYTVALETGRFGDPFFVSNPQEKITTRELKVISGGKIEELSIDSEGYELERWMYRDKSGSNITVKFPLIVENDLILIADVRRISIKVTVIGDKEEYINTYTAYYGNYFEIPLRVYSYEKPYTAKSYYMLEDEEDLSSRRIVLPSTFKITSKKDFKIYTEYEERKVQVKVYTNLEPEDKAQRIHEGKEPYESVTLYYPYRDLITQDDFEKHPLLNTERMKKNAGKNYFFAGWSKEVVLQDNKNSTPDIFPLRLSYYDISIFPVFLRKSFEINFYTINETGSVKVSTKIPAKYGIPNVISGYGQSQQGTIEYYLVGGPEQDADPTIYPTENSDKSNVVKYTYQLDYKEEFGDNKVVRLYPILKTADAYLKILTYFSTSVNKRAYIIIPVGYKEEIKTDKILIDKIKEYYGDDYYKLHYGYEIDTFRYTNGYNGGQRIEFPFYVNSTTEIAIKWKPIEYNVTFNYNYLENGEYKTTVKPYSADQIVTLEKPERPGYEFKGWYFNQTPPLNGMDDEKIDKNDFNNKFEISKDVTLYARWEAKLYEISYEGYGLDRDNLPKTYSVLEPATIPVIKFDRSYLYRIYQGFMFNNKLYGYDKQNNQASEFQVTFEEFGGDCRLFLQSVNKVVLLEYQWPNGNITQEGCSAGNNPSVSSQYLSTLKEDIETLNIDPNTGLPIILKQGTIFDINYPYLYNFKHLQRIKLLMTEIKGITNYSPSLEKYRQKVDNLNDYEKYYNSSISLRVSSLINSRDPKISLQERGLKLAKLVITYNDDSTITYNKNQIEDIFFTTRPQEDYNPTNSIFAYIDGKGFVKKIQQYFDLEWYDINYDLDGGVEEPSAPLRKQYSYFTETFRLNTPIKENYNFLRWINENNYSYSQINKGSYQNYNLKAIYTPVKFSFSYYDGFNDVKENGIHNKEATYAQELNLPWPSKLNDNSLFLGWQLVDKATKNPINEVYFKDNPDVNVFADLPEYKGAKFVPRDKNIIYKYNKDIAAYAVYKDKLITFKFHMNSDEILEFQPDLYNRIGGNDLLRVLEPGKIYEDLQPVIQGEVVDPNKEYVLNLKATKATSLYSIVAHPKKANHNFSTWSNRVEHSSGLDSNFEPIYAGYDEYPMILPGLRNYVPNDFSENFKSFEVSFLTENNVSYSSSFNLVKEYQDSQKFHYYPHFTLKNFSIYIQSDSSTQYNQGINTYLIDNIVPETFDQLQLPTPQKLHYKFLGYNLSSAENDISDLFMVVTKQHYLDNIQNKKDRLYVYPKFEKNINVRIDYKNIDNVEGDSVYVTDLLDLTSKNGAFSLKDFRSEINARTSVFEKPYYSMIPDNVQYLTNQFNIYEKTTLENQTLPARILFYQNNDKSITYKSTTINSLGVYSRLEDIQLYQYTNNKYSRLSKALYDDFSKDPRFETNGIPLGEFSGNSTHDFVGYLLINSNGNVINEDGVQIGEYNQVAPEKDILINKKIFEMLYKGDAYIAVVFNYSKAILAFHTVQDFKNPSIAGREVIEKEVPVYTSYNLSELNDIIKIEGYKAKYVRYNYNDVLTTSHTYSPSDNKRKEFIVYYDKLEYGITYFSNYGANDPVRSVYGIDQSNSSLPTRYYIDSEIVIPNVTKQGYVFKGWKFMDFQDNFLTTEPIKDLVINKEFIKNTFQELKDIRLSPTFEVSVYNVTFDYGYENKKDEIQVEYRSSYNIPTLQEIGENKGHIFVKWIDNLGKDYNPGIVVQAYYKYDITFKAVWKKVPITVLFQDENQNQITSVDYYKQYNHDENSFISSETLYEPLIDDVLNYHVTRWYIDSQSNGQKDIMFPYTIKETDYEEISGRNRIIIRYEKALNVYDLLYDYDGGYEDPQNPNPLTYRLQTQGSKLINIHNPIKYGSSFVGYTIDGIEPEPRKDLQIDTIAHRRNLLIKAHWIRKTQLITFDSIYGLDRLKNVDVAYGEKVERPKDPQVFGYKFIHWYTDNMFIPYRFENTNVRKDLTIKAFYQRYEQVTDIEYIREKPNTIVLKLGSTLSNFSNLSYNKNVLDELYKYIEVVPNVKPILIEPVDTNKLEFTFNSSEISENMIVTFKKDMPIYTFVDQQARATGLLSEQIQVVYYNKEFTSYKKAHSIIVPTLSEGIKFDQNGIAQFHITVQNPDATVVPILTGYDTANYQITLVDKIDSLNQFTYKVVRIAKETDNLEIVVKVPELDNKIITILQE